MTLKVRIIAMHVPDSDSTGGEYMEIVHAESSNPGVSGNFAMPLRTRDSRGHRTRSGTIP